MRLPAMAAAWESASADGRADCWLARSTGFLHTKVATKVDNLGILTEVPLCIHLRVYANQSPRLRFS